MSDSSLQKTKPYWQQTGGPFGIAFGVGLLALAGFYLFPILTTIVWNTINLAVALCVGGALAYILLDGTLARQLAYGYKMITKKIWGLIVETDPFIIAETNIEKKEKETVVFKEQINKITKVAIGIKKEVSELKKRQQDLIASIKKTQELIENDPNNEDLKTKLRTFRSELGQNDETIEAAEPMIAKLDKTSEYLSKIYTNLQACILDLREQLKGQKRRFEIATAGSNALRSALSIFKGDPKDKALLEFANEMVESDIAAKLAAMQNNIKEVSSIVTEIEIGNAVNEDRGIKYLEALSSNKDNLLISDLQIIQSQKVPRPNDGRITNTNDMFFN